MAPFVYRALCGRGVRTNGHRAAETFGTESVPNIKERWAQPMRRRFGSRMRPRRSSANLNAAYNEHSIGRVSDRGDIFERLFLAARRVAKLIGPEWRFVAMVARH